MAGSKRKPFSTSTHARTPQALRNLEQVRPTYFFTPDIERAINRLEGVTSARVLTTGSDIDEIHVIGLPDRPPKKIVRDIESLLLVSFGIRIDHRKISIVQTDSSRHAGPPATRLRIQSIESLDSNSMGGVRVQVSTGDTITTGIGYAREGESELHSSSRAVISAVEQTLNTPGVLVLDHLQLLNIRESTVVIVIVHWLYSGQEELLAGASVARGNLVDAAAKATLDAMNRKLVRLHPTDPADH